MKIIPLMLGLVLPLSLIAAEVKLGDDKAAVHQALGIPRGRTQLAGRELYYYDRGEVELRSGQVTRVTLRSVEEQAALDADLASKAARFRDEQEIRRARLTVEGDALKARKLSDPSFQSSPISYQVAFWEDFSRRYPDVSSVEQLGMARARLAEQVIQGRAQAENAQKLAELEARVAEAEARTAEASSRVVFTRVYRPYRNYSHNDSPFGFGDIKYQFFESPLPYATSPGMPLQQPKYREDSVPSNRQDDWRNSNDTNYLRQRSDRNSGSPYRYAPRSSRF